MLEYWIQGQNLGLFHNWKSSSIRKVFGKMKREFEAEIAKKKERQASRDGSGSDDGQTKVPLVERTSSPPVPALREKVISKD